MTNWLTAIVSLAGLLVGAGLAIMGALYKSPELVNVGSTIVGGALGLFVPHRSLPSNGHAPARKSDTTGT